MISKPMVRLAAVCCFVIFAATIPTGFTWAGGLDSWNESSVKTAIIDYLADVTDPAHGDFIPVAERIAVLDNDGTFWCERPGFPSSLFQSGLLASRAAAGIVDATEMPFSAWIANDTEALREFGWKEAYVHRNTAFAGMPVTAFRDSARAYLKQTIHPELGVTYPELYYAPMLELARLLEAHQFQVWVVTGGEQDFVRSYIEEATGVPCERVIGSWTPAVPVKDEAGNWTVVRAENQEYNGHEAKIGNIETRIGRHPVFAAGNSNNDQPMCRYAVTGTHRGMAIWIQHDDSDREYSYDKGTNRIAGLVAESPDAYQVSIKNDWKQVFKAGIKKAPAPTKR